MKGAFILLGWVMGGAAGTQVARGPLEHASSESGVRSPALVGVIAAAQALDLLPQVEGRLEQLQVRLGEHVEAGQVIALLDTRTRQLELAARQAQLQAAEVEHTRSTLLLRQARQLLEREQRVRDYTAGEEVEKAENAVALAATDVALARARVSEAQAQVSLSRENLEQARIRAPFAGTVSEEYLQPGMLVGRTTPIVRLVGRERLLRFAIPEALAGSLRRGQPVRVHAGAAQVLDGTLERISPELDTVSRHMKAEARLNATPEASERLPVGALVPVELGEPSPTGSPTP